VLQCVAVRCSVLQCVAVCCSVGTVQLHTFLDGYCSTVQGLLDWLEVDLGFTELLFIQIDMGVMCVFVYFTVQLHRGGRLLSGRHKCSVLQCVAVCCSVLQCVAVCCRSVL